MISYVNNSVEELKEGLSLLISNLQVQELFQNKSFFFLIHLFIYLREGEWGRAGTEDRGS